MLLIVYLSAFAFTGVKGDFFSLIDLPDLISAVNATLTEFLRQIFDGISIKPVGFDDDINTPLITLPNGLVLNVGIVTLPTAFLCRQTGIILNLACRIGTIDCIHAHNRFSGACGMSPNPVPGTTQADGEVFVCNDQPPDFDFTDISEQCGTLLGTELDELLDGAIKQVVLNRLDGVLCSRTLRKVGCSSDCRNNHQYASGTCVTNADPVSGFLFKKQPKSKCICNLSL